MSTAALARTLVARSPAAWAAPVYAAIGAALLSGRRVWATEWRWALDHLGATTILLGPVAAGVSAAAVAQWRRNRRAVVIAASPSPYRHVAFAFAGVATWTVGAQLVITAAAALLVLERGSPGSPNLLTLLPPTALLLAWVGVGTLAGAVASRGYVPALVTVMGFAIATALARSPWESLVRAGGATSSLVGLEYRVALVVWQTAFWLLVAATTVAFAGLVAGGGARRTTIVSVVLSALTVTATWMTVSNGTERLRVDATPPLVCAGEEPRLCLAPEYAKDLDKIAKGLQPMFALLREAEVEVPTRVEQGALLRHRVLPEGLGTVAADEDGVSVDTLVHGVVNSLMGCDIDRQFDQSLRTVMSTDPLRWLLAESAGGPDIYGDEHTLPPSFVHASRSDHIAWIARAVPELRACRPAPAPVP